MGFQWLDGGFLDRKAVEPKDVDVITFHLHENGLDPDGVNALAERRPELFGDELTLETFCCDAYFIDLDGEDKEFLIRYVTYWVGLFSHQRVTGVRRGLVQIPLGPNDDDGPACDMLQTLEALQESATSEELAP